MLSLLIAVCTLSFVIAPMARSEPPINQPTTPGLLSIDTAKSGPLDCGYVFLGGHARRDVVLRNLTGDAVALTIDQKSCFCVEAAIEPATIGPGESAILHIDVKVAGGTGPQRHGVVVGATPRNGGPAQQVECDIQYTPDRSVEVSPAFLDRRIVAGAPFRAELFVMRLTPGDLTLTHPTFNVPGLSVEDKGLLDENPTVRRFEIHGAPERIGTVVEKFTVEADSARRPHVGAPLYLTILSPLRAVPPGVVVSSFTPPAPHPTVELEPRSRESVIDLHAASVTLTNPIEGLTVVLDGRRSLPTLTFTLPRPSERDPIMTEAVVWNKERVELARVPVIIMPARLVTNGTGGEPAATVKEGEHRGPG